MGLRITRLGLLFLGAGLGGCVPGVVSRSSLAGDTGGIASDVQEVADQGVAIPPDGGAALDATAGADAPVTTALDASSSDGEALDAAAGDAASPEDAGTALPRFSFFVTSIEAMRMLSGSQDGFGGDLRFGEATGLAGADKICATVAELGMPGASQKTWRAFLSASTGGPAGGPTHAIERIGEGPWYDRNARLVANDRAGLLAAARPDGDPQISSDLPNERGESQRNQPGPGSSGTADNHDVLTASNEQGQFQGGGASAACNDWTSAVGATGRPNCGHSWPANSGQSWIRAHPVGGCAAFVNLAQDGPGPQGCDGVGCGGGYGAIYCFALTP